MHRPYSLTIIEDEPDIRRLLETVLRRDDRLALDGSFDNVSQALAAVRGKCPDVIVCDVSLPGMSGLQAIPLFREICPDALIVMYTADPEHCHRAGIVLGADAVIGKDATPPRLFEQVVELLEQRTHS